VGATGRRRESRGPSGVEKAKKFGPFLDVCVSSLRRGHAKTGARRRGSTPLLTGSPPPPPHPLAPRPPHRRRRRAAGAPARGRGGRRARGGWRAAPCVEGEPGPGAQGPGGDLEAPGIANCQRVGLGACACVMQRMHQPEAPQCDREGAAAHHTPPAPASTAPVLTSQTPRAEHPWRPTSHRPEQAA
jgi:hypothetical protein